MADADVLVVGAGLAGLVAARALSATGAQVVVLDKSSRPGGRLATRRIGAATLDHGAQFFTVRSDEFARLVDRWRDVGAPIDRWSTGFAQAPDIREGPSGTTHGGDGHPRYVVSGGMNTLAKVLADDIDVITDARVTAAWVRDDQWQLATVGAHGMYTYTAPTLLVTCPVPQTLALLDRGRATPSTTGAALRTVTYDPCLALLVVLDRDPGLPPPGGVQFASGPVRWLADNADKAVSSGPAVTLHAAGDWSADWYHAPDDIIGATLHALLAPWLGPAAVVAWQLKRWRYAQPRDLIAQRALRTDVEGAVAVFAGDAFGSARVEGAARSGLAAAAAINGS